MEYKQRKPARADWIDYDSGAFFITVCTDRRRHFFGSIRGGEMHLSTVGRYLDHLLSENNKKCKTVRILNHVVMPNHIHMIAECIVNDAAGAKCGGATTARPNAVNATSAVNAVNAVNAAITELGRAVVAPPQIPTKHGPRTDKANKGDRLPVICGFVGRLKSAVTRFAHESNLLFEWQRSFHDHLIRNYREYNRIDDYITNNVARWADDCFHGD